MPFIVVLLLWPLLEIAGFAWAGSVIGVLPTLGLVILSCLIGVAVLRISGFDTVRRLRAAAAAGETPVPAALAGAWRAIAGILLIVPGFLSSAAGLLLLLPPVQRLLTARAGSWLRKGSRVKIIAFGTRPGPPAPPALDGEFRELPPSTGNDARR
jgi:UPF0716 protein FxsA